MRIILKDPTLILTTFLGIIFGIAMIMLLVQMISETEDVQKSWDEMSCAELKAFYSSPDYKGLDKLESDDFEKALQSCRGT